MNGISVKFQMRLAAILISALLLTGLLSAPVSAAGPAPGVGLLVHNWWGEGMTLNIGFAQYKIPAYGTGFVPLAAGTYDLSVNVNGRDESSRDARIVIPAGQAVDMSYWLHVLVFETIALAQPETPATAGPTPPANSNPNQAAALDTQWHPIDGNQSLWYRFELFSHDDEAFGLEMPLTVHSRLNFEIYASGQISDWWRETPTSVGNVDGDSYTWGLTGGGSSVWYVRVINSGAQSTGFQFTYHGPIVTSPVQP